MIHRLPYTIVMSLTLLFLVTPPSYAQGQRYPAITAKKNKTINPDSPDPLVNYEWPSPKASDGLQQYDLFPIQTSTNETKSFKIEGSGSQQHVLVKGNGIIRFDFGRVSAGWLEFEAEGMMDSITMSISEYNEPAIVNTGAFQPNKTMKPVKSGNTYRLELNPEWYEGVRFGWLHVHQHNRDWRIKGLRLVCQVKPVNYMGSFSCSDPRLTRIWYTGAYTVKLNLQQDYFGAILMERSDRHSWTGDAYPSQAAAMVAFGNYDFVRKNISNTANLNNGIASYSLYWVLSLIDYINYTGDLSFASQYTDNVCRKLDTAFAHFGKSPSLGFYGWDERLGAGFENPNIREAQHAYSMLSIRTWRNFSILMEQMGNAALAVKYKGYAERSIMEIRRNSDWLSEYGLHAAADAINTGLLNASEVKTLYERNFSDRLNRLSYSPFNQYFILQAMSASGQMDDALDVISDYWGGQLDQGATTFYEVYRPSWNTILPKNGAPPNNQCGYTSLTHPWSAGVVKWLSEEVLGIKPLEPGFKTFEVKLNPGRLPEVSGGTPTLNGLISVSSDLPSGNTSLRVPQGTTARILAIPLNGNDLKSLYINDTLQDASKAKNMEGRYNYEVKRDTLIIKNLSAGAYHIRVRYVQKQQQKSIREEQKTPLPWIYPISAFTQDSLSGGQWQNKYGNNGYVLFNFHKTGEHLQRLPAYLSKMTLKMQADVHQDVQKNAAGTAKSADGRSDYDKLLHQTGDENRSFGAIITKDPLPTAQTITIDLHAGDDQSHQLSLYFLDWDMQQRRSAVEIFDLESLKLLSPVQLINGCVDGKYLSFQYKGSIRVRINQLRGKNAALSGLFFD